jgi:hypothetical protein
MKQFKSILEVNLKIITHRIKSNYAQNKMRYEDDYESQIKSYWAGSGHGLFHCTI